MELEGIALILSGLLAVAFVITVLWLLFRIAWAAEARNKPLPRSRPTSYRTSCSEPNQSSINDDLNVEELWKP